MISFPHTHTQQEDGAITRKCVVVSAAIQMLLLLLQLLLLLMPALKESFAFFPMSLWGLSLSRLRNISPSDGC